MKTIIIIVTTLIISLNTQAQSYYDWNTSLDVSAKASMMLGIAPTITITQDYTAFRFGGEYSYSLSRYDKYRHHTAQLLLGVNFYDVSVEAGIGSHINNNEYALAWSFGARFRFENKMMMTLKTGSDFVSLSVGYTLFK